MSYILSKYLYNIFELLVFIKLVNLESFVICYTTFNIMMTFILVSI